MLWCHHVVAVLTLLLPAPLPRGSEGEAPLAGGVAQLLRGEGEVGAAGAAPPGPPWMAGHWLPAPEGLRGGTVSEYTALSVVCLSEPEGGCVLSHLILVHLFVSCLFGC